MARILGISGSLRAGSYNTALLLAAHDILGTREHTLELASIALPLYNADLDTPPEVERLQAQIEGADGVLIATPEYNYGIPGPLKNALDWASRPAYQSVFAGKPVGILGATGSTVGTARAQGQLKQVLLGMVAHVFPYPEFLVARAFERFTDGALTDDTTAGFLTAFLDGFVDYAERLAV